MRRVIIFLSLLLVFSCKKSGDTHVKGRVLNPITGKGFANVEVALLRNKLDGFASSEKIVAKTTTDEEGNFELHHFAWLFDNYIQVMSSVDAYEIGWFIDGKEKSQRARVGKGKTTAECHYIPYGKINFRLKNENCNGNNDTLILHLNYSQFEYTSLKNPNYYIGCFDYLPNDNEYNELPMGNWYIKWEVIKNGVLTTFYDTVFLEENKLTTVEFYY